MTKEFCLMTTSVDDRDLADNLASRLVESHMAACVQVIPIHSTYRWNGKVQTAMEYLLIIKTLSKMYIPLEKAIREGHPYELPEILRLPVDGGFPPYLEWIKANVE